MLSVISRMALTFRQSRQESLTDALTALPNRRALARDLRERAPAARPERPLALAIFDLNGFKAYNDRYGHPAGDALLVRLSRRLRTALAGRGSAYRMGGDEFCALLAVEPGEVDRLLARALDALTERGDGFTIEAAHGLVRLPDDACDPVAAMELADQRMYARKHSGRVPVEQQTSAVLLALLEARRPAAVDAPDGAAELAVATGRRLGMDAAKVEVLGLATRLRDVGKTAVPREILGKPGPLDAAEWEIVRRHPEVGERVLQAAPALVEVGRVVRAGHERFDGAGYPDGLGGAAIALVARVVAVCDAFEAMTRERPHARRRCAAAAAAELSRCAGAQFDPAVVDAFLVELEAAERTAAVPAPTGAEAGGAPLRSR